MATQRHRYESKNDTDDLEQMSIKLSADLRKNIRALASYPVLSDNWCGMADILGRIAAITEMESKLPRANAQQTLWEGDEQALRYVIEDGKLNICLRNLVDYKEYQRDARLKDKQPASAAEQALMDKFEKGLGGMLKNAWNHIEALQTSDLPMLIDHISAVFNDAAKRSDIRYTCTKRYSAHFNSEDRLMPLLRSAGTVTALAHMLVGCYESLGAQAVELACCTLSA
eukprot:7531-Heterococcus_DN1.PRE.1